jgi:hypothetical protein
VASVATDGRVTYVENEPPTLLATSYVQMPLSSGTKLTFGMTPVIPNITFTSASSPNAREPVLGKGATLPPISSGTWTANWRLEDGSGGDGLEALKTATESLANVDESLNLFWGEGMVPLKSKGVYWDAVTQTGGSSNVDASVVETSSPDMTTTVAVTDGNISLPLPAMQTGDTGSAYFELAYLPFGKRYYDTATGAYANRGNFVVNPVREPLWIIRNGFNNNPQVAKSAANNGSTTAKSYTDFNGNFFTGLLPPPSVEVGEGQFGGGMTDPVYINGNGAIPVECGIPQVTLNVSTSVVYVTEGNTAAGGTIAWSDGTNSGTINPATLPVVAENTFVTLTATATSAFTFKGFKTPYGDQITNPLTERITAANNTFVAMFEEKSSLIQSITLAETLTVTGTGNTGTITCTVDNPDTMEALTWSSSNPAIASVDQNGVVTAVSGGKVTVTAENLDGSKSGTCEVTIKSDTFDYEAIYGGWSNFKTYQSNYMVDAEGRAGTDPAQPIRVNIVNAAYGGNIVYNSSNTKYYSVDMSDASNTSTVTGAAFANDKYLTGVTLNSNCATLSENVFQNCTALTSVYAPGVTTIDHGAIRGCTALTSVYAPDVTTIGQNAFRKCTALIYVSLPEARTIGHYAFRDCTALISASLPEARTIGESTFYLCTDLITVYAPFVTEIGNSAFKASGITVIPNMVGLTTIGTQAFSECLGLDRKITLNCAEIPELAFSGCSNITEVDLSNVTKLGPEAFSMCDNLKTVTLGTIAYADMGAGPFYLSGQGSKVKLHDAYFNGSGGPGTYELKSTGWVKQ